MLYKPELTSWFPREEYTLICVQWSMILSFIAIVESERAVLVADGAARAGAT